MRRNCNLTLRLVPPPPLHSDYHHHRQQQSIDGLDLSGANKNQNQNQQLTIFYGGMVSVCDVTDAQGREIIKVASEEIEEKWRSRTPGSANSSPSSSSLVPSPSGLSMKVSLQRFLQKRKHRIQATSPYDH